MTYNLLIADDEPSVLAILSLFFERLGYRITTACDGQEAIDIALTKQPDLILLDFQMPRKNGLEVVSELRADPRFAETPMIALTAHARDHSHANIIRAGFNQVVIKPFELAELRDLIARHLRSESELAA